MAWGDIDEIQEVSDVDECTTDFMPGSGNENLDGKPSLDSDSDGETRPHRAATMTEKQRADNAIFKEYANRKIVQITQKEVSEVIENVSDDKMSIRDILAKEENTNRIVNPRDYQTELFQRAKDENTIAILDTGTGKTHIATLLLRHVLDEELEARAKGHNPRIAFFLVSAFFLSDRSH